MKRTATEPGAKEKHSRIIAITAPIIVWPWSSIGTCASKKSPEIHQHTEMLRYGQAAGSTRVTCLTCLAYILNDAC
jgi:hypothetical protein